MDVLQLLAQGMSDKQIGRHLGISDQTARKHRSHLLDKTGVGNVCALLFEAFTSDWLTPPPLQPLPEPERQARP
ncbi:response regulator transcription factor [Chitinimonas arctica]|uniref:Response regulator transcription factor n=2 Tax=Chitinimonas arctica TaxID=2594795 RepID=A0A516SJP9_9NEIS|nr:response regulator transcription factor [Chitinimonas arctica]